MDWVSASGEELGCVKANWGLVFLPCVFPAASKVEEKRCFAPQPMLLRPMRPNNESSCLHGTARTPPDWSNLALECHPGPSSDPCALPALWFFFLFVFSLFSLWQRPRA